MIQNLKTLYSRVIDKEGFISLLAEDFKRTPQSMKSNWLSSWAIPEKNQYRVHELLINFIKQEIKKSETLIRKKP